MAKKYEYSIEDVVDKVRDVSNQVYYLDERIKYSIICLAIGLIGILIILTIKLKV